MRGEIVVDTNVILKLFFKEADSDKADSLYALFAAGRIQIVAPDLLALEFVNILWIKVRQGELTRTESEEYLSRFAAMSAAMVVVPTAPLLDKILVSSIRHDHASYDTAFVALAESRGVPFVTADRKLHRKVPAGSGIVLLEDFDAPTP